MLGELMRFRYAIAVAGTHGKTTTTSMLASLLAEGGLDPTFVIGGRLISADTNARLGQGKYLVAEADESDASFIHLQPMIAIVTNVDNDHLGTHEGDFERLKQSFIEFLHNLPFYGLAVICADDREAASLLPRIARPVVTYGIDKPADIRATNIVREGLGTRFDVLRAGKPPLPVRLNRPGKHNVLNALAAIAVATELEVADAAIQSALTNSKASIGACSRTAMCRRRTVASRWSTTTVITQPNWQRRSRRFDKVGRSAVSCSRSNRTVTRARAICSMTSQACWPACEALIVTEVYAAGEAPISGADGKAICRAVRSHGRVEPVFVDKIEQLPQALAAQSCATATSS